MSPRTKAEAKPIRRKKKKRVKRKVVVVEEDKSKDKEEEPEDSEEQGKESEEDLIASDEGQMEEVDVDDEDVEMFLEVSSRDRHEKFTVLDGEQVEALMARKIKDIADLLQGMTPSVLSFLSRVWQ